MKIASDFWRGCLPAIWAEASSTYVHRLVDITREGSEREKKTYSDTLQILTKILDFKKPVFKSITRQFLQHFGDIFYFQSKLECTRTPDFFFFQFQMEYFSTNSWIHRSSSLNHTFSRFVRSSVGEKKITGKKQVDSPVNKGVQRSSIIGLTNMPAWYVQ